MPVQIFCLLCLLKCLFSDYWVTNVFYRVGVQFHNQMHVLWMFSYFLLYWFSAMLFPLPKTTLVKIISDLLTTKSNFHFPYYSILGQYSTQVIPWLSGRCPVLVSSCLAGPSAQSPSLVPILPTLPRLVHFCAQPSVLFSLLFLFTPLVIASQIILSTGTSPRAPDSHTSLWLLVV